MTSHDVWRVNLILRKTENTHGLWRLGLSAWAVEVPCVDSWLLVPAALDFISLFKTSSQAIVEFAVSSLAQFFSNVCPWRTNLACCLNPQGRREKYGLIYSSSHSNASQRRNPARFIAQSNAPGGHPVVTPACWDQHTAHTHTPGLFCRRSWINWHAQARAPQLSHH